jgi:Mg2+ and Co2+ transporter CorA
MSDSSGRDPQLKNRPNQAAPDNPHPFEVQPVIAASLAITVITSDGVKAVTDSSGVRDFVSAGKVFWIDLVGGEEAARAAFLNELDLDDSDIAWLQRFGQSGRMSIGHRGLRVVTWLWAHLGGGLIEIHLMCSGNCVLTVWNGDARLLDDIRKHFGDRSAKLETSPYQAAAILLQMILSTLHFAVSEVDARLQALEAQLTSKPGSIDFHVLKEQSQRLQSVWFDIDRYGSAVKTAIIGVEALPGVGERGAVELNDYGEQVEDLGRRLQERSRWGGDLLNDYATDITRRQGEQVGRLTLVSLIFLPITFLTGFFGMNFRWMLGLVDGPTAFLGLGVALPALCVIATVLWLKRRGLI